MTRWGARRFGAVITAIATGATLTLVPCQSASAARCDRTTDRTTHGTWTSVPLPRTPEAPDRDVPATTADEHVPGNRIVSYAVDPASASTAYVADEWTIMTTTDAGCHWSKSFSVLDGPAPDSDVDHIVSLSTALAADGSTRVYALLRRGYQLGTWPRASLTRLAIREGSGDWEVVAATTGSGAPVQGTPWQLWVAPGDADVLYLRTGEDDSDSPAFGAHAPNRLYASTDGGTSWESRGIYPVGQERSYFLGDSTCVAGPDRCTGVDARTLTVDPLEPDVLWTANDSGVFQSTDGGRSWVNRQPLDFGAMSGIEAISVHHERGHPARVAVLGALQVAWSADAGHTWRIMPPPPSRSAGGDEYTRVTLDSAADGRRDDELLTLLDSSESFAGQVMMMRRSAWINVSPPWSGCPLQDDESREAAGKVCLTRATYVSGARRYFFLTQDAPAPALVTFRPKAA